MKTTLIALTLACSVMSGSASAENPNGRGSQLSSGSDLLTGASAVVVYGSLAAVAVTGSLVAESVEVVGDSTVVVLKGVEGSGLLGYVVVVVAMAGA